VLIVRATFGVDGNIGGIMPHRVIAARTWSREFETETAASSLETVILFSLFGLAVSAMVLVTSSAETIASIAAAMAM
jgi:hypothetical protein